MGMLQNEDQYRVFPSKFLYSKIAFCSVTENPYRKDDCKKHRIEKEIKSGTQTGEQTNFMVCRGHTYLIINLHKSPLNMNCIDAN